MQICRFFHLCFGEGKRSEQLRPWSVSNSMQLCMQFCATLFSIFQGIALHCMQKIIENSNGLVTVQTCFSNHVRYLTLSATRPRFFTGTQTILPTAYPWEGKNAWELEQGGNYCWLLLLLLLLVNSFQFQCRTTVKRGEWVVAGQWQNIPTCCIRPPPCQPGQNWSES